jgi:hypothetical protein
MLGLSLYREPQALLPQLHTFGEVFASHREFGDPRTEPRVRFRKYTEGDTQTTCGYCTVERVLNDNSRERCEALRVEPTEIVQRALENSLLYIEHDSIYFQIIIRDGLATIRAKYNNIIGYRLIATVDAATVPQIVDTEG